jgi:hypothetical protein
MGGPVSGGYAGRPYSICWLVFLFGIYASAMWRAYQRRNDPAKRMSVEQVIGFSLFFAFMAFMMFREIYRHNY